MSTEIKISEQRNAPTTDEVAFMLETEYNNQRYVSFVQITGQSIAYDRKEAKEYLDKAKNKFIELIKDGKIKSKDKVKFCFWLKGDFIKFENKSKDVKLNLKVSRYSSDRLHIEIPKEYRHLFEEDDEIKVIKE